VDNPLIVHVDCLDRAMEYGKFDSVSETIGKNFWPGPLTIVVPRIPNPKVTPISPITCALDSIAIRVPSHPLFLEILSQTKLPIAAPSANLSGKPSPTCAAHVLADLGPDFPVVDGGACDVGLESTIVRVVKGVVHILRPGKIGIDELGAVLPGVEI